RWRFTEWQLPQTQMSVIRPPSVFRGAREVPAVDPDGRHQHAAAVAPERPPLAADRARRGECLEVALGEAEVADGSLDLAVLDVERPVARHAGDDRELGMDRVRVMEARHEHGPIEEPRRMLEC